MYQVCNQSELLFITMFCAFQRPRHTSSLCLDAALKGEHGRTARFKRILVARVRSDDDQVADFSFSVSYAMTRFTKPTTNIYRGRRDVRVDVSGWLGEAGHCIGD